MADLDLTGLDETALAELREHKIVTISPDKTVAVPTKKGMVSDPHHPDGLMSYTQSAIVAANPQSGCYRVPTADEWQRESTIRATPNPWRKGSWNLTRQMTLSDQDPDLATRFKQEAGVR